jgi:Leucine-rich repeat (LRR) protein
MLGSMGMMQGIPGAYPVRDLQAFEQTLLSMHEELQNTSKQLNDQLNLTQAKQEELMQQQKAFLETISEASTRPGSSIGTAGARRPLSAAELGKALSHISTKKLPAPVKDFTDLGPSVSSKEGSRVSSPKVPKTGPMPSKKAKTKYAAMGWDADLPLVAGLDMNAMPSPEENAQDPRQDALQAMVDRLCVEEEIKRQELEWQWWDVSASKCVPPAPQRMVSGPASPVKGPHGQPLRHVYLEQLLSNDKGLTTLDLANHRLTAVTAYPIAVALSTNTNLKRLVLDHNQLDDATASAFSKVLASNRSLARLSMQGNDISPLGAQDLVNGFVQSASLKQLSLQSNDFGPDTLKELIKPHRGIVVAADGSLWKR